MNASNITDNGSDGATHPQKCNEGLPKATFEAFINTWEQTRIQHPDRSFKEFCDLEGKTKKEYNSLRARMATISTSSLAKRSGKRSGKHMPEEEFEAFYAGWVLSQQEHPDRNLKKFCELQDRLSKYETLRGKVRARKNKDIQAILSRGATTGTTGTTSVNRQKSRTSGRVSANQKEAQTSGNNEHLPSQQEAQGNSNADLPPRKRERPSPPAPPKETQTNDSNVESPMKKCRWPMRYRTQDQDCMIELLSDSETVEVASIIKQEEASTEENSRLTQSVKQEPVDEVMCSSNSEAEEGRAVPWAVQQVGTSAEENNLPVQAVKQEPMTENVHSSNSEAEEGQTTSDCAENRHTEASVDDDENARLGQIRDWITQYVFRGHKPLQSTIQLYSQRLLIEGFESVEMIMKLLEESDVNSYSWMKGVHKRIFLGQLKRGWK